MVAYGLIVLKVWYVSLVCVISRTAHTTFWCKWV